MSIISHFEETIRNNFKVLFDKIYSQWFNTVWNSIFQLSFWLVLFQCSLLSFTDTLPKLAMAVPSMTVKQWNFHKAKWSHYIALMNKFAKTLLLPDSLDVDAAYQDFCNTIKKAAKKTIPCRYQNNYIPCWDAECESLYKTFLQSPQGDNSCLAATTLLAKLNKKQRNQWSEAVRSIDFSHSSQKAWSILNNLTGRSWHSPCHCPVSADAIAFQLVRNEKYEAVDCKSSQLVFQEVSDLWRATTPDTVNISDNFSQREFAAALQHLKTDKTLGSDFICSELILWSCFEVLVT